jgi:CBS domain-containing protein
MKPDVPAMDANMQLDKAWQCMREGGWPLLPVTENGLLIGILTTDNLADYFALRSANQM